MKARCTAMLKSCGGELRHDMCQCAAGTFHSVGCQITRRYVNELGDTGREGFTIFDQDDSKAAMKKALQQLFSRRKGKVDNIIATVVKDAEGSETTSAEKLDAPEWVSLSIIM